MEKQQKADGMEELVRQIPKPFDLEICFFAEPGSFIRLRGSNGDVLYGVLRQITYRCGSCGQPVIETDMHKHFDSHTAVPS